jgi:hypothetical protein
MSPHGTSQPISNSLLAKLPAELLAHLMSKFTEVDLPARTILISSDRLIEHAYFPLGGMISLVKSLQDGSMVEVELVGKEGFTGVPLALRETTDAIDFSGSDRRGWVKDLGACLSRRGKSKPGVSIFLASLCQCPNRPNSTNGRLQWTTRNK